MEWPHHPLMRGAISGFATAAAIDYAAFRSWKSFQDALTYSWGLALWRWGQGAVIGIVTAMGTGPT